MTKDEARTQIEQVRAQAQAYQSVEGGMIERLAEAVLDLCPTEPEAEKPDGTSKKK